MADEGYCGARGARVDEEKSGGYKSGGEADTNKREVAGGDKLCEERGASQEVRGADCGWVCEGDDVISESWRVTTDFCHGVEGSRCK